MKKFILLVGMTVVISSSNTIAQSWNLTGNAGTDPNVNCIGTIDFKALKIKTNNISRLYIKGNGDIGIGTTNPTQKLDINGIVKSNSLLVGTSTGATGYVASIGGKLIAEEVRVDLQAAWPDYVFSENHQLMSLDDLQQWITDHKHLPGIPSAVEIKGKGIMLGEMQTKSIEKIEEAMLYILQLNKENHELKAQVDNLQQQVTDLSKNLQKEKQ